MNPPSHDQGIKTQQNQPDGFSGRAVILHPRDEDEIVNALRQEFPELGVYSDEPLLTPALDQRPLPSDFPGPLDDTGDWSSWHRDLMFATACSHWQPSVRDWFPQGGQPRWMLDSKHAVRSLSLDRNFYLAPDHANPRFRCDRPSIAEGYGRLSCPLYKRGPEQPDSHAWHLLIRRVLRRCLTDDYRFWWFDDGVPVRNARLRAPEDNPWRGPEKIWCGHHALAWAGADPARVLAIRTDGKVTRKVLLGIRPLDAPLPVAV